METKIYFRDMEGYRTLTEHQKKYVGKSAVFDLELLPDNSLREEATVGEIHPEEDEGGDDDHAAE